MADAVGDSILLPSVSVVLDDLEKLHVYGAGAVQRRYLARDLVHARAATPASHWRLLSMERVANQFQSPIHQPYRHNVGIERLSVMFPVHHE